MLGQGLADLATGFSLAEVSPGQGEYARLLRQQPCTVQLIKSRKQLFGRKVSHGPEQDQVTGRTPHQGFSINKDMRGATVFISMAIASRNCQRPARRLRLV